MGSSIKINSISIDLASAADSGKCEHFSMRGFVAEIRERDRRKCWPFSADTVQLADHESYTLPSLSVVKSRWWRCASCIRDINAKEINDSDFCLQSHSKSVNEKKLDAVSSAIPSKRKKEKKNDVERYQKDDHTAAFLKKVRHRAKDVSSVKSKSGKLATQEKVKKKSKEKANISMEYRWKETREAVNGGETTEGVTAFGSPEVAGVVDDTPDKASKKNHRNSHVSIQRDECDNVSSENRNLLGHNPECVTGLHRRKPRKVRLLSDLLNYRVVAVEPMLKRESVKYKKRKSSGDEDCGPTEITNYASRILSTMGKTSENASKSCDSEDKTVSGSESRPSGESQSTDSGFDKDPIKGKQRNKRFQVVEDRFPETSQKDTYEYASPVHSSFAGKEFLPCPLHTERTEKEPSLAKKRKRKATVDNKKSTMITFSNNMDDGRKPDNFPPACPRTTMPQSTRDFLNSNWLDRSFDNLTASDGHPNIDTVQRDVRPAFPLPLQEKMHYKNGDRVMLRGVGTTYFRDFGSTYKSTNADGCLRTGVNVEFTNKGNTARPSSLNDNLRQTASAEVAGGSRALQKDFFPVHGKGKEVVVQELSAAPRFQSTTSDHIDDIPMEIVELLAKNQYERCLPDREEDKQPSQATTSLSKNALLIDLNETYDNSMDNALRQPKPSGMHGDVTTKEGHFITGKQNSLEFFPTSQFGQPYNVPSGFGISPLTRDNHSSSIQFSGVVRPNQQSSHNPQWLGNVPTTMANQQNPSRSSFRVLRPCNTCQSVQQQQHRDDCHPTWPSSMTSSHVDPHKSVSLSMQNFMDQSRKIDNPSTRNLNFDGNEKQKPGLEGGSSKPLDTYSSESSIPAMHLLSLMDPRLRSNIPTDQSRNSKIVIRPFSTVHQPKECTGGPQPGDCNKTAYSPNQWRPFDFHSKRATPETPRENFAIIPPVGTSSFSFQSEKSSAQKSVFTFQSSWNHHQEKNSNSKVNNFAQYHSNSPHQNSMFTSSSTDPGKFRLLGASDSMKLPLRVHVADNAKKQKTKKGQYSNVVSALLPTNPSVPLICRVNRNPADFTIANAPGNIYMIKGQDLKVRKHSTYKKKPSLCKQDALTQNKKSIAPAAENA